MIHSISDQEITTWTHLGEVYDFEFKVRVKLLNGNASRWTKNVNKGIQVFTVMEVG